MGTIDLVLGAEIALVTMTLPPPTGDTMIRTSTFARWVACMAIFTTAAASAQTKTVTFAHQDMLVPLRMVMESRPTPVSHFAM
jgi:hypothetical protein